MAIWAKGIKIRTMRIGIIGGSAAGLYAAILLAKRHPDFHITVIEKNEKAGKKLLATGNGHCNLFNADFSGKQFNHPDFVDSLLKRFPKERLLSELHGLGIATLDKDGLIYPLSYSAASHVRYLVGLCRGLGVEFRFGEKVISTKHTDVKTDKGNYAFDKLIYAFGGCSQANLGSDGSLFPLLKSRGYHVTKLEPSLCPLVSPDVPKSLFGVRHKCLVKLTKDKKTIYQENGEILFKKDGLSGIAVMNASSYYEEGTQIEADLFPDLSKEELEGILSRCWKENPEDFLAPVLEKPLAEFTLQKCQIPCKKPLAETDFSIIAEYLKCMKFRIFGKYDFDSSQVTRGGISLSDLDANLSSKMEDGVFFSGECVDIDGLCGGFNLGWALLSAFAVADSL